jgi:hypothetical protein
LIANKDVSFTKRKEGTGEGGTNQKIIETNAQLKSKKVGIKRKEVNLNTLGVSKRRRCFGSQVHMTLL